jgi:hypothetical protein
MCDPTPFCLQYDRLAEALQFQFEFQLTFSAYRRPESRAKHGEGVFDASPERPTTSPAATSGRRPRRGKRLLSDVRPYDSRRLA